MIGCLQRSETLAMFFSFGDARFRLKQFLFTLLNLFPQLLLVALGSLRKIAQVVQLRNALFGSAEFLLERRDVCCQILSLLLMSERSILELANSSGAFIKLFLGFCRVFGARFVSRLHVLKRSPTALQFASQGGNFILQFTVVCLQLG